MSQDMIRFYLGEEPLLDQVETFDLGEPRTLERALDVFDELVIKDRGSYGGLGVVICPHAERADVEELRERVRARAGRLRGAAAGRALDPPDRDRRTSCARATSTCDRSC